MTRTQSIALITSRLADLDKLDDARLEAIAEALQSTDHDATPLRELSAREVTLLEQSKADFAAGRSYSLDQIKTMLDDELAPHGVPRSTA